MAKDGLLFRGLAQIHACTGTPVMAIMSSGSLVAIKVLLLDLGHIVELMLTGIMLAYTLATFSVLVLRYQLDLNEKTEEEVEMVTKVEEYPLNSVPETGTSNILKTLWFPTSTTPPGNLARLSRDVPSCSAVLLHLDPCSSPADHPEPDPGPVAQLVVLLRPRAHNSGCAAAAAHHWGHSHHLEAAPEPLSSSLQGPCSACPPTGEHLCECLLDDAVNPCNMGPMWSLECHWICYILWIRDLTQPGGKQ
ncbi:uncharacterized protein [Bos mutus]|uniref:uncharacterized protein n=1 Tax=Bos mutus TaxID=72004 RepID=UPI0038B69B5A